MLPLVGGPKDGLEGRADQREVRIALRPDPAAFLEGRMPEAPAIIEGRYERMEWPSGTGRLVFWWRGWL